MPGIVDTVPAFSSLLVCYDPLVSSHDSVCQSITHLADRAGTVGVPPSRSVELPCCYAPDLGLDIEAAAQRLGVSVSELVGLHSEAPYIVYFVGFTPGLPYMIVPERIQLPRLETPRTAVPPGSVGIGGIQCCIYSVESPGGYWILGRTPLRLYDPGASDPTILRPGDEVRFRVIDRAEFDEIAAGVTDRTFRPKMETA